MSTVDDLVKRAEDEGWGWTGDMRSETESLDFIHGLLRCLKPEVVVETGTYLGHGTEAIVAALDRNDKGHLWTVELAPPGDYKPHERITFVTEDTLVWADNFEKPIDFAFVDCSADPAHRVQVASLLRPQSKCLAVHDTIFFGLGFLATLIAELGPPSLHLETLNGLTIWK